MRQMRWNWPIHTKGHSNSSDNFSIQNNNHKYHKLDPIEERGDGCLDRSEGHHRCHFDDRDDRDDHDDDQHDDYDDEHHNHHHHPRPESHEYLHGGKVYDHFFRQYVDGDDIDVDVSIRSSTGSAGMLTVHTDADVHGEPTRASAGGEADGEETEEAYRKRVYGAASSSDPYLGGGLDDGTGRLRDGSRRRGAAASARLRRRSSSVRDLSRRLSREISRRGSSLVESLPDTPSGWAALVAVTASAVLGYELRLQRMLTSPPLVFGQETDPGSQRLREILSKADPGGGAEGVEGGRGKAAAAAGNGILARDIKPSLLVGTRGVLSSAAAYARPHLVRRKKEKDPCVLNDRLRFREVFAMGSDGARVGVDWEIPPRVYESSLTPRWTAEERKREVLVGPIQRPVVIILHGINNDASFGYIRSLMRACVDRGWIAAGYNFRECGGVELTTPRGYTGSYTGDMRSAVRQICDRMESNDVPVFLVGNSLGANLVTKYLGEEGLAGTLPPNVAGGVSLGNPLLINSGKMSAPWAQLLGLGVRKSLFLSRDKFRQMTCHHFQRAFLRALLLCQTIGSVDDTLAPFLIRNDPIYPFTVRVGYRDGEDYWDDASSFKYVQHVSVPLLKVTAQDDFLVYGSSLRKMSHCLDNPNVTVVKTKCGGHLGWQESPPDTGSVFGFGTSWADTATADFIAAVIRMREEDSWRPRLVGSEKPGEGMEGRMAKAAVRREALLIRSRL